MKHKFLHQQKFHQKLSLTPQLRQSIQLLGMSLKDIGEYIDNALSQNPYLQKVFDKKARLASSTAYEPVEVTQETDLRSTLLSQIRMMRLKGKELEIAEFLIYEMDDNGYITADLGDLARELGVTEEKVKETLGIIQTLDPAGIGCRTLTECLQLQLKRKDKELSIEYKIVGSFLNEVAKNDVENVSKALKADIARTKDAFANIKKLNTHPGSSLLAKKIAPVIPELLARITEEKVRLEVNKIGLPRLKMYNPHQNDLDIIKDAEAREFLKANLDAAKNLIDNLKWRENTICKVADYILRFQKDALTNDGAHLKTLTLKDVAGALNFHPSTISRTISNKFIQINDEVMPIKNLLSHGIKNESGGVTSKTAIKRTIETIVKNEDASNPLSDKKVTARLKAKGIALDRRTIAKYRNELKILPAYLRKKVNPLP